MKYQKLASELNSLFDSATRMRDKHQSTLKHYLEQFKSEEKKLYRKLETEKNKSRRKKLKRELGVVKQAYVMLVS